MHRKATAWKTRIWYISAKGRTPGHPPSTVPQPEVAGSVRGRRASDSRKCKQRIVNIIYYSLCSVYKMS